MSARAIIAISLLFVTLLVQSAPAEVDFIYPPRSSWANRSDYLILKLNNPEVSGVRINLNGVPGDLLDIGAPEYRKAFRDMLIVQPAWDQGKNQIVVELYKGKERVESAASEVFYSLTRDPSSVPPEFKPFIMHTPAMEKLCAPCHNMKPTPAQMNSNMEKDNPCFGCHKKMLGAKFVHGPAGTYSCGYCHDTKNGSGYAVPKREAELCNECHADKAAEFKKRKYVHGPIAAGLCEVCHDSHGTPYPFQLRAKGNEVCLSCHEKVRKEPHVVRTTTGEGHPVSGFPDPSKPGSGKDISCISCHNPHSGDVRFFFQNNAEDKMLLCQMCHNK